ncbi:hypothetical protein DGWBC_1060 [Dehalogenimonas sp. WBC-2]|nr:hypothetical protein DGWBC_1060 [Dehalogenimonas sp. WBC-2]
MVFLLAGSPVYASSLPPTSPTCSLETNYTSTHNGNPIYLFDSMDLPVPSDWWVNMVAATLGVLIAYGVYYLRLRTIARQRELLEIEVAERTIALKLANDELDREIQRRAEFNRALVHELKTPLTAILASAELFVDELVGDHRQDLAKNIFRAAQNLDRRTDELLDVTRGEIGILTINPVTTDIRPLLQNIIEMLKPAAARKHQSLDINIIGDIPPVHIDDDRLRQVLYNYVINAIKYTPEKGHISLKAYGTPEDLNIEVTDNGPGISQEGQKRLFEPYYRVPQNGTERLSGMGLGLALSKMIIQLHGGRVWVNSAPGQGAVFGFSVPLAKTRSNYESTDDRRRFSDR